MSVKNCFCKQNGNWHGRNENLISHQQTCSFYGLTGLRWGVSFLVFWWLVLFFFFFFYTSLQALPFLPLLLFLDSQSCDECIIGVLPFCSDVERMVLCCTLSTAKKKYCNVLLILCAVCF